MLSELRPIIWYCLSLQSTDERGRAQMSGTTKYCLFSRNYNSQAVSFLYRHFSTVETLSGCLCCDQRTQLKEILQRSRSPNQAALSGVHQASPAAWPLHGDGAGFNYPQLCFISPPQLGSMSQRPLQRHRSRTEVKVRRREKQTRGGSAHLCTHLKSNVRYCFLYHLGRIV